MSKRNRWLAKRLPCIVLSGILIISAPPNEVLHRVLGATGQTLIPRCKRHISISEKFCALRNLTTGKHSRRIRLFVSQIKASKLL
jgi:hypothetical protein